MAPLKLERLISVTSEDSLYPAESLLKREYNDKKWKCKSTGEKQIVAIFQLEKPSKINSIDVGNEYSAFIEVLVGKSSSPDSFEVLLGTSSLMPLHEAKYGTNGNGVRFFKEDALCKPTVEEKWDRIKVVCSQPYNKGVQYGLSFIVFHGVAEENNESQSVNPLGRFKLKEEKNDAIDVGSLFARRKEIAEPEIKAAAAAIRASSSDTQKIVIKKELKDPDTPKKVTKKENNVVQKRKLTDQNTPNGTVKKKEKDSPHTKKQKTQQVDSTKKMSEKKHKPRLEKPFGQLLEGVVFVISGYQNPLRSEIRSKALALGAKYKADWDNSCTHLVCAFVNTPKFNQVRGQGKIVRKDWIEECYSKRTRFPWRRYALDRRDLSDPVSEDEIYEQRADPVPTPIDNRRRVNSSSSEDTEDEIQRVIANQLDQPSTSAKSIYDEDTEYEEPDSVLDSLPPLSDVFKNMCFHLSDNLEAEEKVKLKRYIVAHQGMVVDLDQKPAFIIAENSDGLEEVRAGHPESRILKPEWIWQSHDEDKTLPFSSFEIT